MKELKPMKQLKFLTIAEFNEYTELLKEDPIDKVAILKVFGLNIDDMSPLGVDMAFSKISLMDIPDFRPQKVYNINGRRFYFQDNIHTITGGQFIDYQSYVGSGKPEQVLSVFMIPMKRRWWGGWTPEKYGKNYSVFEVQQYLLNNMWIGDAVGIAAFFLDGCLSSLKVIQTCLEKASLQGKEKKLKSIGKKLGVNLNFNGFKL